jgi:glutamine cyclotransferase
VSIRDKFSLFQKPVFYFITFVIALSIWSCSNHTTDDDQHDVADPANTLATDHDIPYTISNAFSHDTTSYTEGFLFHEGQLYESTGYSSIDAPGSRSWFGPVDISTGKIQGKAELEKEKYFGEGIAFLQNKIFQLTWQNKVGFIYDAKSFKSIGQFNLPTPEGWGMTTNGQDLVMSDGSDSIFFIDPNSFKVKKILTVKDGLQRMGNLNELEFINGFLYANKYLTNYILKIDTITGNVAGQLNLVLLDFDAKNKHPSSNALNGIAFDKEHDKVLITGKLWPNIYEIKFDH